MINEIAKSGFSLFSVYEDKFLGKWIASATGRKFGWMSGGLLLSPEELDLLSDIVSGIISIDVLVEKSAATDLGQLFTFVSNNRGWDNILVVETIKFTTTDGHKKNRCERDFTTAFKLC